MHLVLKSCGAAAFLASALTGGQAHATVTQLTSPASLSSSDTKLVFSGSFGQPIGSPASFTAGNNTLTFSSSTGPLEVDQAGYNYGQTAFANGTNILFAGGFQGNGGPVTLQFMNAVTEFGFNIEEFNGSTTVPYLVSFAAFDGARLLGTFTASGTGGQTLSFEGLSTSGGDVITSLLITDNFGANANLGFGPITFGSPSAAPAPSAVPEPASLMLLGIGVAGLAVVRRRRNDKLR